MSDEVEIYQPDEGLAMIDQARALLAQAETVEAVADLRDNGEAVRVYASRRTRYKQVELEAQDFVRRAERKLGELLNELREAGQVKKGGRPRKAVNDAQGSDVNPVNDAQPSDLDKISPRDLFGGDAHAQRDAYLYASINEDDFNEVLADARANGDMSRQAIARALRGGASTRTANGDEITPIARVMTSVFRNLAAVVERLQEFDPATIEHDDRKEWRARLTEYAQAIDAWRKALPR